MNGYQKISFYNNLISTQPASVVRKNKDLSEKKVYCVKMEYKIGDKHLLVNTFMIREKQQQNLSYKAIVNYYKGKKIVDFNNELLAKKLYEHGQRHL